MNAAQENPPHRSTGANVPEIRDLTLGELEQVVIGAGERSFRARQVMRWLWTHGAESFDVMLDVPGALRTYLKEHFRIGPPPLAHVARSADGTRKLLLRLGDAEEIESVIIPADDRVTLCISSQAGCAMACEFCATALMGLHRNLEASEIVGQVVAARRELDTGETLTNYVFMGMGEPLANYHGLQFQRLGWYQ